jgi:hypothetical protein
MPRGRTEIRLRTLWVRGGTEVSTRDYDRAAGEEGE